MGEHRAFRLAGGARGEHHLREIVGSDRSLRQRLLSAGAVGEQLHLVHW